MIKFKLSLLILTLTLLTSCEFVKDSFTFKDKTKEFVESMMNKDYDKCISQMALESKMGKNTNLDTLKLGLDQFRDLVERNFGSNKFEYSLMKSEKKLSTNASENTPPNTTLALIEFSNEKDFGVFQVLFDDNSKNIINIKTLEIKAPKPNMLIFWLFGLIPLTVLIFNIYDTGLRGVKARAHRWFEVREQLTDANGNFNVSHQFRYPVDYSIKWERNDFNIRSGRHGQAYFNGPHQRGDWNLDIVNNNNFVSWFYGQIHRGAFDYYYNNSTGLRTPPKNGFLGSRIAIGVLNEKGRANYKKRQRNWFGPEIFMYTSEDNGNGGTLIPSSLRLYETTIHELAHASHFNISHWHYRNTDPMVKESWAVGVEWIFATSKYSFWVNDLQTLRLQNAPTPNPFDVVNWGERKYTPLVIDLIDEINQRANNSGNSDFPIDRVSCYTIRNVEDALVQKRTMEAWRDQLKTNKPSGVTDALLNELFDNYIPLQ